MHKIVPFSAIFGSLLVGFSFNGARAADVPLKKSRGTWTVSVELNGAISLDFTVDSGAADVTITADVLKTLKQTGTLTDADYLGTRTYVLANGQEEISPVYMMRSLKVGNHVVQRVRIGVTQMARPEIAQSAYRSRSTSCSRSCC